MSIKQLCSKLIKSFKNKNIVSKMLVFSFVSVNNLDTKKSSFINKYLSTLSKKQKEYLSGITTVEQFSIDELIDCFEYINASFSKKSKGVVYTPKEVREFIVDYCILNKCEKFIDPSCGCGSFLITVAKKLNKKYGYSYSSIYRNNICGVDIDGNAIKSTKIMLSLLALLNNEDVSNSFNLVKADMLIPKTSERIINDFGTIDAVVGNPPYVRYKNVSEKEKKLYKKWESSNVGNVDLYMPFFEIGHKLTGDSGIIAFITPNSYLQGLNARELRKYLISFNSNIKIYDFRAAQVFLGVTSYTCITTIKKSQKSHKIGYCRIDSITSIKTRKIKYYAIDKEHSELPWRFSDNDNDDIIYKLENAGKKLSNWKIRNGIATLKNDIYIFKPTRDDGAYYYREYNGKEYRIEKNICIDIAKPNVIHDEKELNEKMEKAIFPYVYVDSEISIIEEKEFLEKYPKAYKFLCEYKDQLLLRDKGNGKYPKWYSYGRTQGLNNKGAKLLIPYIAGNPVAVLSKNPSVLYYCGYALFSDSIDELTILKKFLESDAFWFYISNTSKPYSKGYMAFAKNYITKFSIPELSKSDCDYLKNTSDMNAINKWIWEKYGIYDYQNRK